jgi:hypothetical protein
MLVLFETAAGYAIFKVSSFVYLSQKIHPKILIWIFLKKIVAK